MELFTGIFFIVAAIWLFWISMMMKTENTLSFFLFKGIPFALGLCSVFLALHHYGWIIQVG